MTTGIPDSLPAGITNAERRALILSAADPFAATPLGSRWYVWRYHWEIVAHETKEGDPVVRLRRDDEPRPAPHPVPVWRFLKYAVPSPPQATDRRRRRKPTPEAPLDDPAHSPGGSDGGATARPQNAVDTPNQGGTMPRKSTTTEAKADPAEEAPKAAAPEPTPEPTPDADSLEKALLDAIRSDLGKIETVKKKAYVRVIHDGNLVTYIRRGKNNGLRLQLEAYVGDETDVAAAVATIKSLEANRVAADAD